MAFRVFEASPDHAQAVEEEHGLEPLALYARRGSESPVRYLGVYRLGDGMALHTFRDLRDQGLFYRHLDDVADMTLHPLSPDTAPQP